MSRKEKGIFDKFVGWIDELAAESDRADFRAEALLAQTQLYQKETPRFQKERLEIMAAQHDELTKLLLTEFRNRAFQLMLSIAQEHEQDLNRFKSKAVFLIMHTPQAQEALKQADLRRLAKEEGWAVADPRDTSPPGSEFCFFPTATERENMRTTTTNNHSRVC